MAFEAQTIPLDQYPATPLDNFPDALQRVPLADIGLDGLVDAMVGNIADSPFVEQDRSANPWKKV